MNSVSSPEDLEIFSMEVFGLVDNHGVVGFEFLDYPSNVTQNGNDEDFVEHQNDWMRVSLDDLTQQEYFVIIKNGDKSNLSYLEDDISHVMVD